MKSYVIHISYFAVLLVLLVFSFATNNYTLTVFFGSAAAFATDPLLLLGSFAIGALSKNLKVVLPAVVVFGVVASIYIANLNEALGAQLQLSTTVMRTITVIGLALIANAVRIAASGLSDDSLEKHNSNGNDGMNLKQLDQILEGWKSSLCDKIEVGALYSRNPTAHKWKTTYRALVLRELTFWRVTYLLDQASILLKGKHYLGSLILVRSTLETLAVLIFLNDKILKVTNGEYAFFEFGKLTNRLMLGSRRPDSTHQAVNILTVLEKAEKKYPGLQKAYDDLSECAHPNSEGMGVGFSRIDRENFITIFEDRWHKMFARSQLPLIELCLRIFESEYNEVYIDAMESLENWLVENDAELEARRTAGEKS